MIYTAWVTKARIFNFAEYFIQNNKELTPPQTLGYYARIPSLQFGFLKNSKNCL